MPLSTDITQHIYASAATQPFSPAALRALLTKARTRNSLYGVTGMLLYHEASFLQVLEGPEASISLILASIHRDLRHQNSRTLSEVRLATREFPTWSMGFADTTTLTTRPPGLIDYYRDLHTQPNAATKARQYLRFFHEGLYHQQPTEQRT